MVDLLHPSGSFGSVSSVFDMYRSPVRPTRSPGPPRPPGRFPSPASCWGFPGPRSPYEGSGHRSGSPRGSRAFSPGSPVYSPGSYMGYRSSSPVGLGGGSRGGFGGQMWRRSGGFPRPQSVSPASAHTIQVKFIKSCIGITNKQIDPIDNRSSCCFDGCRLCCCCFDTPPPF